MTVFLVMSALLVAGTLLFVVPPLLRRKGGSGVSRDTVNAAVYRDQLRELEADLRAGTLDADLHERVRQEIEKRLLEDVGSGAEGAGKPRRARAAALAMGFALPLLALAIYFLVGNPQALSPGFTGANETEHGVTAQQMQTLVDRLAARLKEAPDNPEGWAMLGRSYGALGRFDDASAAYAEAVARLPRDAQLLADYADTLAMAQGRRLQGEPEKLIARALRADPDNVKALALAGTVAFENKDYRTAVGHWERILDLMPQESDFTQSLRSSIAEARELGGVAPAAKQQAQRRPAAAPRRVSGPARLAPGLAAKTDPTDTVFIFARAAEGPRMPLAILRKQVRDLPLQFTLDDSMAMTPETKLSAAARVVVGARISKSADATPRPGDLEGLSAPVKPGAAGVVVVIDRELRDKK
jgi:cytochrome c-type biogenesis protein CcmH